jgi:FkbM family methyltransferase
MFAGVLRQSVGVLKSSLYGRSGEPYRIGGHLLRFTPGSRPIRLRYANSENRVNRYDALQLKLLSERVMPGAFALDVGGHVGAVALVMAACAGPTGRVISFEPDPAARAGMEQNFDLNPGVKRPAIEPVAVSDAPGESIFFTRGGDANSSLYGTGLGGGDNVRSMTVTTVALDDYLVQEPRAPDWVKIDIEGAEVRALQGATRLLASEAEILCELHPYAWSEAGSTFDDLRELVAASGRRMRYLDSSDELTADPIYGTVLIERA